MPFGYFFRKYPLFSPQFRVSSRSKAKEQSHVRSPQYTPVPPQAAQSGLSDNAAGAIAYITIIPAIIFLLVEPYNKSSFVRFHAWQSIFLGIAAIAVGIDQRDHSDARAGHSSCRLSGHIDSLDRRL